MELKFLFLNGYGQFVWPAFFFTFVICFYLYLKTKKELQKQEKLYLKEFRLSQTAKIVVNSQKENTKKVLSGNSVF